MIGLYGIADCGFGPLKAQVELLLSGEVCALQLRCKTATPSEVEAMAKELWPLCQRAGTPLILNDHFLPHCSDGVHLGQQDGGFTGAQRPPGFLVGRSTHNLKQVLAAIHEGADYVGFGPIFPTGTKSDVGPTLGLEALEKATQLGIPVVAIGGIQETDIPALKAHGCASWTAISAIWNGPDSKKAIRDFSA
jgi:thiamine-phosphate pyrophosphorylase